MSTQHWIRIALALFAVCIGAATLSAALTASLSAAWLGRPEVAAWAALGAPASSAVWGVVAVLLARI